MRIWTRDDGGGGRLVPCADQREVKAINTHTLDIALRVCVCLCVCIKYITLLRTPTRQSFSIRQLLPRREISILRQGFFFPVR